MKTKILMMTAALLFTSTSFAAQENFSYNPRNTIDCKSYDAQRNVCAVGSFLPGLNPQADFSGQLPGSYGYYFTYNVDQMAAVKFGNDNIVQCNVTRFSDSSRAFIQYGIAGRDC